MFGDKRPRLLGGQAAGRWAGPGFVYCMRDGDYYKIGCSREPRRRLEEIRRQRGRSDITLICEVGAHDMRDAETAAQQGVQSQLGMVKTARNATDWHTNPCGYSEDNIIRVIKRSVENHNTSQSSSLYM